jgi:hypothetical protein
MGIYTRGGGASGKRLQAARLSQGHAQHTIHGGRYKIIQK